MFPEGHREVDVPDRGRELYTVIQGESFPSNHPTLGLRQGAFLEIMDITGQTPLFANPFGAYSATSMEVLLKKIGNTPEYHEPVSLMEIIEAIKMVQGTLENFIEAGLEHPFVYAYCSLKGYALEEVKEQIRDLRSFVNSLEKDPDLILGSLLNFRGGADAFFQNHSVLKPFGIIASGNLGLYETVLLLYSGLLAIAAKNGHQFSCLIKPSSEDFLFYDLIFLIPEKFRGHFSRITWRSDLTWDQPLMITFLNSLEGAIYFGKRKTLLEFRKQYNNLENTNHHFYFDHFPLMIIGDQANADQIQSAARLAIPLCYKNKGEACLSLQDVFVHKKVYKDFIESVRQEVSQINRPSGISLLPRFSQDFLADVNNLRQWLIDSGATVSGRIGYEPNRMDLMLAYDLEMNHPVFATENAAPFLAIASYSNEQNLIKALKDHLRPGDHDRTADKHIYSFVVGVRGTSPIICHAEDYSHRLVHVIPGEGINKLETFQPYKPGVPHCGGFSFLGDMFGISHSHYCFVEK
jgi:hypothetical protein